MEKAKLYYRNEAGEFCAATEWFKENGNNDQILRPDGDFRCAVGKLEKLIEFAPRLKTFCARAILGAKRITEYARTIDYFSITVYKNGDCAVWYMTGTTGGTREEMLQRVFADIDRLIEKQREFAAAATAEFVEI